MLPIYKALSFIGVLPGGTTQPWAIYVLGNDNRPHQYVVKVFKDKPLQPQPAVANEVLGSVMASLFELPTPEPAFIEFTPAFVDTLGNTQLAQLAIAQPGLKFGCRFMEGPHRFSSALATRHIAAYDIEAIYAFDNLILNRDRDLKKPNMLLFDEEAYLIDHEISIMGSGYAKRELISGQWTYQYQEHVFHNHLRTRSLDRIQKSFGTFTWYLQNANFDELDSYSEQLIEHGFDVNHFWEFRDYLNYQRANSTQFEEILKRTLL